MILLWRERPKTRFFQNLLSPRHVFAKKRRSLVVAACSGPPEAARKRGEKNTAGDKRSCLVTPTESTPAKTGCALRFRRRVHAEAPLTDKHRNKRPNGATFSIRRRALGGRNTGSSKTGTRNRTTERKSTPLLPRDSRTTEQKSTPLLPRDSSS